MKNNLNLKLLLIAIFALTLSACATSNISQNKQQTFEIPENTPQKQTQSDDLLWRPNGSTNFEATHPGLGKAFEYRNKLGVITVYTYNLQKNWNPGTTDPDFNDAFNMNMRDIYTMQERGYYKDVKVGNVSDITLNNLNFRKINFDFTTDGARKKSTTYLTAVNGHLLKYRITIYKNSRKNINDVAKDFIESHSHENIGTI